MNAHRRMRVAILLSGRGSNMAAIAAACADGSLAAQIVGVIADRASAGIALAESLQLPTEVISAQQLADRKAFETALIGALERCDAELIALAGFLRILSADFVQRYSGRLLNIHPSLLPRHRGLETHRRVLEAGEPDHGASVHFVTAALDAGPVVYQGRVAVQPGDTADRLAARVLAVEHRIYPATIGLIAAGRLKLVNGGVRLDDRALLTPLLLEDTDAPTSLES